MRFIYLSLFIFTFLACQNNTADKTNTITSEDIQEKKEAFNTTITDVIIPHPDGFYRAAERDITNIGQILKYKHPSEQQHRINVMLMDNKIPLKDFAQLIRLGLNGDEDLKGYEVMVENANETLFNNMQALHASYMAEKDGNKLMGELYFFSCTNKSVAIEWRTPSKSYTKNEKYWLPFMKYVKCKS